MLTLAKNISHSWDYQNVLVIGLRCKLAFIVGNENPLNYHEEVKP